MHGATISCLTTTENKAMELAACEAVLPLLQAALSASGPAQECWGV